MNWFVRIVRLISQACGVVAGVLVAAGVVVICQMVIVRYALNQTTIWQTDFTTYCLVGATFIGSPYLLLSRGHVNVDVLPRHVTGRSRFALAVFAVLVSLLFSATATVLTFNLWHEAYANKWVSDTMWRARMWIPYAAMPIGLGLLSLQLLADLIELVTGRAPPFGIKPDQPETVP